MRGEQPFPNREEVEPTHRAEASRESEASWRNRRETLAREYEAQGITVERVDELLDKLRRIISDPESVVEDSAPELARLETERRLAQVEYDRLYHEMGRLEKYPEKMEEDEEAEDAALQARREELAEVCDAYAVQGDKVSDLVKNARRQSDLNDQYERGIFPHPESFYCVTSDNLPAVRGGVDVHGKKVATVASNGDFWQIFTEGGAKEVTVFDISLPALMYTELKMAGLENLGLEDYLRLVKHSEKPSYETSSGFFDAETYRTVRDKLTPQAQRYFDGLLRPESAALLSSGGFRPGLFARYRGNQVFVGDLVTTDEQYAELQERSRGVDYRLQLMDVNEPTGEVATSDVVYVSNINYVLDDTLSLADRLLRAGAGKVVLTTSKYRVGKTMGERAPEDITAGMELPIEPWLHTKVLGSDETRPMAGSTVLEVTGGK